MENQIKGEDGVQCTTMESQNVPHALTVNLGELNIKPQDFDFSPEIRRIVSQYQWYQRWKCKRISIKRESLLKDIPERCKKSRLRRQKANVYPQFLEATLVARQKLPTVKQFCAAIMDPTCFKCMLAMQPIAKSRRKRSKRLKAKAVTNVAVSSITEVQWKGVNDSIELPESFNATSPLPDKNQSMISSREVESPRESKSPRMKTSKKEVGNGAGSSITKIQLEEGKDATEALGFSDAIAPLLAGEQSEVSFRESETPNCSTIVKSRRKMSKKAVANGPISLMAEIQLKDAEEVIGELKNPDATLPFAKEKPCKKSIRRLKPLNCSLSGRPKRISKILSGKTGTLNLESCHLAQDEGLVDYLIQKLERLSITGNCKELTPYKGRKKKKPMDVKVGKPVLQNQSQLTTYKDKKKKNPLAGKVELDRKTIRAWNLLMGNDDGTGVSEETNKEEEKYWKDQRESFKRQVDTFIERMHLIQGNRRFSQWKGSVLDSVIGVFLTQNVSDLLSSTSFMTLAAEYPGRSKHHIPDECEVTASSQDTVGSNIEVRGSNQESTGSNIEVGGSSQESTGSNIEIEGSRQEATESNIEIGGSSQETIGSDIEIGASSQENIGSNTEIGGLSQVSIESNTQIEGSTIVEDSKQSCASQNEQNVNYQFAEEEENPVNGTEKETSRGKKGKKKEKEKIINWDELRKFYSRPRETNTDSEDSVDWDAVRRAPFKDLSKTIEARGQNNLLAARIKKFLDELYKNVGNLDLEWLRDVPPEKAKEFLLSIDGLGLKSVECVRLLTLRHHAFPVDTNVGRVAVRLGWVPLEPLPENVQIHALKQYPSMDKIQVYLWPRLCMLDPEKLYELHYQLITFGKVFCTKASPNCNACPMRGDCLHFASAFASSKLQLPAPQEKQIVRRKARSRADEDPIKYVTPMEVPLINSDFQGSKHATQECKPIVEFPASPVRESQEIHDRDIEDLCCDSEDDEIPVLRLDTEEFRSKLLNILEKANSTSEGLDRSKELVALTPETLSSITAEAASIPMPNLRRFIKRRRIHLVYELPDDHVLLQGFPKRLEGDPGRYLFVLTGQSMRHANNTVNKQNDRTVYGTIMVPCQTALKKNFALNGTYFQVNEVFADDESSTSRIAVPLNLLLPLRKRLLFCGTSTSVICKGLSEKQIQHIFCRGFVCNRGLNKRTRRCAALSSELCPPNPTSMKAKKDGKTKDEKSEMVFS